MLQALTAPDAQRGQQRAGVGIENLGQFAGAGADSLDGGTGADSLIGGAGNDIYVLDNAGDKLTEGANAGTDTVRASVNFTLGDNFENLELTGTSGLSGTVTDSSAAAVPGAIVVAINESTGLK